MNASLVGSCDPSEPAQGDSAAEVFQAIHTVADNQIAFREALGVDVAHEYEIKAPGGIIHRARFTSM